MLAATGQPPASPATVEELQEDRNAARPTLRCGDTRAGARPTKLPPGASATPASRRPGGAA
eukprot:2990190-Lingulodinium_polyedra.AAC.1